MFTGCESDESFDNSENIEEITLLPDHHDNSYSTRAIDIKDNPKLLEFLEKDVGRKQRNNKDGSAIITDFGEVPLDNIQQVIDTIGNVNYTFALRTNKQYENRFFNLVISQSSEDQSPTPYIVEYAMTPEFKERYNIEQVNMGSFTGFIRTYLLADFDDSVRNVNDCSELPIVVPISSSGSCGEEEMEDGSSDTNEGHGNPVDDGDTSGGGGTSGDGSGVGTGPSGNSSGSVTCNTSISTQGCSICNCHYGTSTECTAGFKASTILTTSCSDGTVNITEITIKNMRSSGCGPSGNMAIIPVSYKSLERVLNLTDSEADCLNENCDLKNQINQFVNQNEVTLNDPELAFANTVIDQLSDSCGMDFEVDFDERVILDSSFINNPSLLCTYNTLKEDSSSLWKETVGKFVNDPKFNLTFAVGECSSTDDQCTDDSDPNNIVIYFEDVALSPLEMAGAIMHESIHAEIARFVKVHEVNADINDRPQLFQLYTYYSPLYDNDAGEIDHIYMTLNYVDKISQALRQFDNINYSLDHYKSIAWTGLSKWDASNLLAMEPLANEFEALTDIAISNSTVCD